MKYNKELVHSLEKETSGSLLNLLFSFLLAQRSQNQVSNQ